MKTIMRILFVLTIMVLVFNAFIFRNEIVSCSTFVFGYTLPMVILSIYMEANIPLSKGEEL